MASLQARAVSSNLGQARTGRPARRVATITCATKAPPTSLDGVGYIKDNSGKGNVFPTIQKPRVKPLSASSVSTSLGGQQGLSVVLGLVGVVALGTLISLTQSGETLSSVADLYDGDSLSTIASRINASL